MRNSQSPSIPSSASVVILHTQCGYNSGLGLLSRALGTLMLLFDSFSSPWKIGSWWPDYCFTTSASIADISNWELLKDLQMCEEPVFRLPAWF
jgi:hypothetical protein